MSRIATPSAPNRTARDRSRGRAAAVLVGSAIIACSTYLLYLLIGTGGVLIDPDSHLYLNSAMNLVRSGDLAHLAYSVEAGVEVHPLTHYPPALSLFYALLIGLGASPAAAPVITALLCWPLLLAGIGVLTYRLGHSPLLAVLALVPAALAYDFFSVFRYSKSEVLFLPLLVWCVALLVDLPQRKRGSLGRWAIAAALLSLMMLTRYPGGFVWLAVGLWWAGWRIGQGYLRAGRWKPLLLEGGLLAAAAVPLALWLLRNTWITGAAVGTKTLGSSTHSFLDGARALVLHTMQTVWPTARSEHLFSALGLPTTPVWDLAGAVILYAVPAVLLLYAAWRYRAKLSGYLLRSPIEVFLCIYLVLLYLVAQAFLDFYPINGRDMATALCLLLPWAAGALALVRWRVAVAALSAYAVLNVAFLLLIVFHEGQPSFIRLSPPEIRTLSGDPEERARYYDGAFPSWLVMLPHTSRALTEHHGALLEAVPADRFVLTNEDAGRFFTPYPVGSAETHPTYTSDDVGDWLERGGCTLPGEAVVVLFTWDRWQQESRRMEQTIDRRCPQLTKQVFDHSILYQPQ